MMRWLRSAFLFLSVAVFADQPLTLFKIDPTIRGKDISDIVTVFNTTPYDTRFAEVAIQMGQGFLISPEFAPQATLGGFIPYVLSADYMTAPNGTLLIVTYNPSGVSTRDQYIVLPVEKVLAVMYSPKPIFPPSIASPYPSGELPRYDMDPTLRAADLEAVFIALNTDPTYLIPGLSSVGIFTTLQGPFNPQIYGGFIPNVQMVTAMGAYLIITYQPWSSNGRTFNKFNSPIIVTAEQVIQMVYYATPVTTADGL